MIYILIALVIFLLDWNIKNYIEKNFNAGEKKELLKGKITVLKQYNQGFSFSILKDKAKYVKNISAFVFGILLFVYLIVLPQKNKALKKIGMSLCLGGAASNVTDRIKRGYVIDYFSINVKPIKNLVFNLADIFIFIGCFITMLSSKPGNSEKCSVTENDGLPEL